MLLDGNGVPVRDRNGNIVMGGGINMEFGGNKPQDIYPTGGVNQIVDVYRNLMDALGQQHALKTPEKKTGYVQFGR